MACVHLAEATISQSSCPWPQRARRKHSCVKVQCNRAPDPRGRRGLSGDSQETEHCSHHFIEGSDDLGRARREGRRGRRARARDDGRVAPRAAEQAGAGPRRHGRLALQPPRLRVATHTENRSTRPAAATRSRHKAQCVYIFMSGTRIEKQRQRLYSFMSGVASTSRLYERRRIHVDTCRPPAAGDGGRIHWRRRRL